ncbi:MAG: hypothetical protein RJA70_2643 [Pseudomonadota bacterium]|jgi:hypothetical protein
MKHIGLTAIALLLVSGTAIAEEYRGDVFASGYSELDIHFSDSKYNNQTWIRPGTNDSIKYHDTLIILFAPGCVQVEIGSPSPFTQVADPMLYWSTSAETTNTSWSYLDDDSLGFYLSKGYIRYNGSGDRRFRIRTTGYNSAINSQPVNIHVSLVPLSSCPASGSNVATLP